MEFENKNQTTPLSIAKRAFNLKSKKALLARDACENENGFSPAQTIDPRFIIVESNLHPERCLPLHRYLVKHGGDPSLGLN